MNIGNVYLMRDQFDAALHWYDLAEPVFRQTGDRYRLSDIYQNRGIAQRSLGHLGQARADFERSLAYHRALDRVVGVAAIADAVGMVDMLEGDYERAHAHFVEALQLLTSIDAQDGPRGVLVRAHLAELEACETGALAPGS
jgi:tetratricopeptide (TPR) repeat protein